MKRAVRLAVTAALLVILITVSLTACGRAERYYFYDIFGTFLEVDASGSGGKKFAEGLAEDMREQEKSKKNSSPPPQRTATPAGSTPRESASP